MITPAGPRRAERAPRGVGRQRLRALRRQRSLAVSLV